LTLGLGLYRIDSKSLTVDEVATARIAGVDFGSMWRTVTDTESNGILYYLLIWPWLQFAGIGEWAMRVFSAVTMAGAVAAFYGLARRQFGESVALLSSLLLGTSQVVVHYAQEARMYGLGMLLVVLSIRLFLSALDRDSPKRWALYSLVAAAAIYTQYWTVWVVLAEWIWLLYKRPSSALAPILATICLLLPLLPIVATHRNMIAWVPPVSVQLIVDTLQQLAGDRPVLIAALVPSLAVGTLVARGKRREVILPLLLGVVPIAATIVVSVYQSMMLPRYLIFALPGLALAFAWGLLQIRPNLVRVAAISFVALLSVANLLDWYTEMPKPDMRAATTAVVQGSRPEDRVVFWPNVIANQYSYYAQDLGGAPQPVAYFRAARPAPIWLVWYDSYRSDAGYAHILDALWSAGYTPAAAPESFAGGVEVEKFTWSNNN
jgi:uncharacterized membrane protein